jgi:transcriptional regulator with XRE-family HTH domain
MLLGMSQEAIADKLGLTFQQVQKYEKGVNRIGASRLFQLATVLGVPVQYFFQDMPLTAESGQTMVEEHAAESAIMDFLRTNDGMELTKAFLRISDVRSRRAILELVRSLGGHDADERGK